MTSSYLGRLCSVFSTLENREGLMCQLSLCWANNSGPIAIIASAYALQALPWMICMLEAMAKAILRSFA